MRRVRFVQTRLVDYYESVENKQPQIIVIAGPNGAGKSTLAPHLLKDVFGLLEFVNADTIARGLSAFNPESVALQAGRIMLERLHSLAAQQRSFAFETTLATRSYATWLSGLKQQGYRFHLLFLWLRSPELAIHRVEERVRIGGHGIAENEVRRRYIRGIHNFFRLYQPLADSWTVFDNSESSGPVLVAVGNEMVTSDILQEELWEEIREAADEN